MKQLFWGDLALWDAGTNARDLEVVRQPVPDCMQQSAGPRAPVWVQMLRGSLGAEQHRAGGPRLHAGRSSECIGEDLGVEGCGCPAWFHWVR